MCVVCKAMQFGDRGGENSYAAHEGARGWQMKQAILAWLDGFGRTDKHGELYLTTEDARRMLLEGKYPDGWVKRPWGCLNGCTRGNLVEQASEDLKCGFPEPWWSNTGCPAATEETCTLYCNTPNTTCISGTCVCGRGSNLIGMCAVKGRCVEREDRGQYFGEKNDIVPATNPSAAGNPGHR